MKTKFFKKLSFVLVVAMVLSLFVPAAGAFAAKAPKLNSTNKYLHLGVDKKNEFNFNVNNKQKGWKYYWESGDENVAVVNEKNGVTLATGVGKTKVTLFITNADGEKVQNLSATVTVRDNISKLTVKNPVDTLAVNEEHDYDRGFETVSGGKKTSAITRWTVEPSENASIVDTNGVFVATEAGEYTITARSFQSKARYNNWLKDPVKYADEVLADVETKVVVGGSMVAADQVNADTVKVSFDSVMEDVKDLNVYQMVGTTKVKQLIKEAKLADDKKSANVTLYIPFTQEATYIVEYPEMDDVSFVTARMKPEDVAYIKVHTTTVDVGETKEVEVKLFNANNVDISAGEGLGNRVTKEAEDVAGTYFDGKSVIIFEKGVSLKVTATYHTYEWDSATGEELGNLQDVGIIMGVDPAETNITGLDAWTIVKENDSGEYTPDFDKTNQIIAVKDEGYRLFVKFNTKTGNDTATVNSDENEDDFVFESSNDEVLIVSSNGELYPNKQGSVTVVVKYGVGSNTKTPIGAIQITVSPEAKASNLVLGTYSMTLSNIIADSQDVTLSLKDQTGRDVDFDASDVAVSVHTGPDLDANFWSEEDDKVTFTTTGSLAKGRYSIKITIKNVTRYVTVNVVSTEDTAIKGFSLELGASKADLKAENGKVNKSISIKLFGLASNGTKVQQLPLNGEDYKLVVDAPHVSGKNWDYDVDSYRVPESNNTIVEFDDHDVTLFNDNAYTLVSATSGSTIRKAPTGTYKVNVFERKVVGNEARWVLISTKSFIVEDTQEAPTVTKVKTLVYDEFTGNIKNALMNGILEDCFEIKLAGELMENIVDVDYNGTNDSLYIRSITVNKEIVIDNGTGATASIDFKVNVGRTIKAN